MRRLLSLALLVSLCGGCATITGTATGALTGMVDAPAQVYRANSQSFKEHPMLYALDVVFIAPLGIVTGPLFGLGKGIALDIQWTIDQVDYGDVFGSYGPASIWRPHTVQWPPKTAVAETAPTP